MMMMQPFCIVCVYESSFNKYVHYKKIPMIIRNNDHWIEYVYRFVLLLTRQQYNYYCLVKPSKQSTIWIQRFVIVLVLVHALICAVLFILNDEQRRDVCWSFCVCSIEKEEDWFLWFLLNMYVVNALTDEGKRLSTQILQLLRIVTSLCLFFLYVCIYTCNDRMFVQYTICVLNYDAHKFL